MAMAADLYRPDTAVIYLHEKQGGLRSSAPETPCSKITHNRLSKPTVAHWADLPTEQRNEASTRIDEASTAEMLRIMNREDASVAAAVENELDQVAMAVELVVRALRENGRLFYIGAGSSGRLGVLDAAECPPTFNTDPGMVQAVIAGGPEAVFAAVEGAEDRSDYGAGELRRRQVGAGDCVIGIAASGVTPFVLGGLREARALGAATILLTCGVPGQVASCVDVRIAPQVGPEVVTGSTRLKAGTATKMILNMISTAAMIRLGKTLGNLMVDLQPKNAKLRDRSLRILQMVAGITRESSQACLDAAGGDLKVAIVMQLCGVDSGRAAVMLAEQGGRIKEVVRYSGRGRGAVAAS